ncbi:Atxe2 family lasso peptide isopeptidase (plasmid) [Sphingobium sp. V4]|uniref:Atxe2 family lasso peptide isopeptidase n=1 Tax=Sphingobium sp. V4 TaxID=3038927 RepID=UPI0025582BA3|nr:Atxe2 family lasso peptide isopeptidase [Sphingobium sp. V4]WIW90288.1 Atxe2 family lasso peptide isopeptidase [Sphingobium sp. V4]
MESGPFFTLSPSTGKVAVGVRRASVANDSYCTGITVIDRKGAARLIDAGPGVAFFRFEDFYGTNGFSSGITKLITPRWSADGRMLAYLKLVGGRLQLRLWDAQRGARTIGADPQDIADFQFSADGAMVIYKVRDEAAQLLALKQESRSGFHYDDRYFPFASTRPFPKGRPSYLYKAIRLADGTVRAATQAEVAWLDGPVAPSQPEGAVRPKTVRDANGVDHVAAIRGASEIRCGSETCAQVEGMPWLSVKGAVRYVRREGWARSEMAIYEWTIGSAQPRRLYATSDLLIDCTPIADDVLCGREGSTRPRYLDRISLETGRSSALFDPNPAFDKLSLGRVERLQWKNDRGIECFGDLTYPPDYEQGRPYPLIVVQYESRGFLRGGTGDEYPVQLFAREGYLVLTVQRPRSPLFGLGLSSIERQRRQNEGFDERRSILSAYETKVRQLIDAGIADPERIGITGLSDGSTTVQYAALHSTLFKAAAVSGCCWEPSQTWVLGSSLQANYERLGWPASPDDKPQMWADISLTRNASRVAFPILMQAADGEYLVALEAVRALKAARRPVDLYVFPDEVHIKRHPAHRAGIYRRNLLWFDFWLRGKKPSGPGQDADEVARWADMQRQSQGTAADGGNGGASGH